MDQITITQAAEIIEECRAASAKSWTAAIDNAFDERKKDLTNCAEECDEFYLHALECLEECYEGWLTFAKLEIEDAVTVEENINARHASRALDALCELSDDEDEDEGELK